MPDLDYFCIENIYPGSNEIRFVKHGTTANPAPSITIEFSLDDGETWNTFDWENPIILVENQKCYFKGNNYRMGSSGSGYNYMTAINIVNVSGNLSSIINFRTSAGYYGFGKFFSGMPIVDASALVLPIPGESGSYWSTFSNCSNLITAPALPATTLTAGCYLGMFSGCTSLTNSPELPATNLSGQCYQSMFAGCTSLEDVGHISGNYWGYQSGYNMFYGCASLLETPDIIVNRFNNEGYLIGSCLTQMFMGCSNLQKASIIWNTNQLVESCCSYMFYGCTSLKIPPVLPATNLAYGCYQSMFYDCSSLERVPILPANNFPSYCYYGMFENCSNLKISNNKTKFNQIEFRLPANGTAGSQGNYWNKDMFKNTYYSSITPLCNTEYYFELSAMPEDSIAIDLNKYNLSQYGHEIMVKSKKTGYADSTSSAIIY